MTDNETAAMIFGIIFGVGPICGVWISAVKARLRMEEKKLELMAQTGQAFGDQTAQQIAALRAEVAALRDTSTQYDLSIQHALDETQQRLAAVESRSRIASPRIDEAPVQKNGLG